MVEELRRLENGGMMRWGRRVVVVALRSVDGARTRRKAPDLAVGVGRRARSGRQPVRQVWRRERRGRRQRYLLHPEDEEAAVEVGEVKVQEDSGRVKDVGVDLLQEVLLLVVKR